MPSPAHDQLVLLFRNRPALAAELLGAATATVPRFTEARLASVDRTEVPQATRLADAVVQLHDDEVLVGAVVVEVQLRQKRRKRFTWPLYVASVRAELECETTLLVLAPDPGVAEWAAAPIELGHPGLVLRPIVVGPASVPVVTESAAAQSSPELAVLSALAHGKGEQGYEVARAMLHGLDSVDAERAWVYSSIVLPALSEAVRARLEEEMKVENLEPPEFLKRWWTEGEAKGREQGLEQGREEGRADARAQDLLAVLAARGLDVPAEVRERVLACRDADVLAAWLVRAVHVARAAEIFSEDDERG
jgi:hypothetical protein